MGIRANVVANLLGKAWSGLANFIFVPIYLKFVGIESYALIGFFASLMTLSLTLDLGLSTTITRELARLSALGTDALKQRELVRSLELIYWAVGLLLGCAVLAGAGWLASVWLSPQSLTVERTTHAIQLMGVAIFLRWPVSLYSGALMGLGHQVQANVVSMVFATLQGLAAVLTLWLIAPTIEAFFEAQIGVALVQIVALPWLVWRVLPGRVPVRFSMVAVRSIFHFAAGMSGITILSVFLTQADKFVVSKLLPLTDFGYYALASSISGVLNMPALAIYAAMFPVLSGLATQQRTDELSRQYHRSCRLASVLILPPATLLIFFSQQLLGYYVRDTMVVDQSYQLLALMSVGSLLLALMAMPLALQLAYGWTRLSLYKNLIAVVIYIPLVAMLARQYGPLGAAAAWISLTAGYFLVEVPVMHRRLLPGQAGRWYLKDVGMPLILCLAVMLAARFGVDRMDVPLLRAVVLFVSGLLALLGCLWWWRQGERIAA
jgi:O-antigen/teichoic acid export membrane protein